MNTIKRTIALLISLALCIMLAATAAFAASKEYPYVYKSPRAMGMGGAYVAVGGTFDSTFYNPSGLALMPKSNWEVNLLGLTGEWGEDFKDFSDDLDNAMNVSDTNLSGSTTDEELQAVTNVLAKYRGKSMHVRAVDLTSFTRGGEKFSMGIGILAGMRADMMAHQGFGTAGFLEVDSAVDYGGVVGFGKRFNDNISMGASVKFINRSAVNHNFSVLEITQNQNDIQKYIEDDVKKDGSGFGVDLGMTYEFAKPSDTVRPVIGVSVLNLGDLNLGDAGEVPMTVNLGMALFVNTPVFNRLVLGLDYIDVLNNYTQDDDLGKRIRFGGELRLFDNTVTTLSARAGLYEGYPTYGLNLRFTTFDLTYTSYSEEIGAYAGQDKDERHMVHLNVGW